MSLLVSWLEKTKSKSKCAGSGLQSDPLSIEKYRNHVSPSMRIEGLPMHAVTSWHAQDKLVLLSTFGLLFNLVMSITE